MSLEIARGGLQDSASRFRAAAQDVAAATTPPRTSDSAAAVELSDAVTAKDAPTPPPASSEAPPDLGGALVEMQAAKHTYSANLRVIETASEMSGSLLDALG